MVQMHTYCNKPFVNWERLHAQICSSVSQLLQRLWDFQQRQQHADPTILVYQDDCKLSITRTCTTQPSYSDSTRNTAQGTETASQPRFGAAQHCQKARGHTRFLAGLSLHCS